MQRKTLQIKTVAEGLGDREFACLASTWVPYVDSYGDLVQRGAFSRWLPFFQEKGKILWQHDTSEPIGKPQEAREDDQGLFTRARVSDTQAGRDALTLVRDGVIDSVSIGYEALKYEMLTEARAREILGDGYDAAYKALPWWSVGFRLLTEIKLYEVSLVSFPANEQAEILGVKGAGRLPETEREFEHFLRDAGYPRKAAAAITGHGYKGLQRDAGPDEYEELAASLKAAADALRAS
jgi:HK97 family phage prohead protease